MEDLRDFEKSAQLKYGDNFVLNGYGGEKRESAIDSSFIGGE